MKNCTLLMIFIFVTATSYAQYSNYKLKDYVNPTYKRNTLDLEFNTSGRFSKTDSNEANGIGANGELSFVTVSNSEKIQAENYINLSTGFGRSFYSTEPYSSSPNNIFYSKSRNFDASLQFNREAYHYFSPKLFFEISGSGLLKYNYGKNTYQETFRRTKKIDTNIALNIGLGRGRIEYVSDAQQAAYILDELQGKGIMKKTLNDDEIHAFARMISTVKNKRQFDPRIKTVDEITAVDSFLVANNYIDKGNAALYFTSLYDQWQYGDRYNRQSGSRFKAGISPRYNFVENGYKGIDIDDDVIDEYDRKSFESSFYGGVYAEYRNEKPINMKWQQSFNINANLGIAKYRYNPDNNLESHIGASYALGYYLNTRTYIKGELSQQFRFDKELNSDALKASMSYTGLNITAYYYLSPQVRLFGQLNSHYNYITKEQYQEQLEVDASGMYFYPKSIITNKSHDKLPNTHFSFGISYAIF